jgi:hypothetical protein
VEPARVQREPARRLPPQIEPGRVSGLPPGIAGRPRPEVNKSANASSGNNPPRCSARNANTPPLGSRCPATEPTSHKSRCGSSRPCTNPSSPATTSWPRRPAASYRIVQQSPSAPTAAESQPCRC